MVRWVVLYPLERAAVVPFSTKDDAVRYARSLGEKMESSLNGTMEDPEEAGLYSEYYASPDSMEESYTFRMDDSVHEVCLGFDSGAREEYTRLVPRGGPYDTDARIADVKGVPDGQKVWFTIKE